jgi:Tol biopolymer transport system component
MNPDGSNIVRLTNNQLNTVSIFTNDGGGGFIQASTVSVGDNSETLIGCDIDGDGDLDLAVAYFSSSTTSISILKNGPVELLDTTKIAFQSNRDGNYEIYVMDSDGTNQTNLTNNPATDGNPYWSPDGSQIVFVSQRDCGGGRGDIYKMNSDGTNVVRLTTTGYEGDCVWSPNGSTIAFRSIRGGGAGEIYVMNTDGTSQVNITNNPSEDGHPSWSPDGNKIVFASWRDGNAEIYTMNPDGSNIVRLTNNPSNDGKPTYSPDVTKIAFRSNRSGNYQIYAMNADGSNVVRLTNNSAYEDYPTWSPDGSKIAFFSNRDGNYEIYVMDADATNRVRLTSNTAEDSSPSWSPFARMEEKITLAIDTLVSIPGDTIMVPINVRFPLDSMYSSAEITFSGYHGLLDFVEIVADSSLIGRAGWTVVVNETDSTLLTAAAGAHDISGEGVLFWLRFALPDTASGFIPLNIESALFNEGSTPVNISSGGIQVIGVVAGDVSLDGEVHAFDASLILKYLVGIRVLNHQQRINANVSQDTTISALDAFLILQFVVGLIDTLPYDTTNGLLLASGDIGMDDGEIQAGQPVEVPMSLSSAENILSFGGLITFDPEHLSFDNVVFSPLLIDFSIETNVETGVIKFSGANSIPNDQEGLFATLQFTVSDTFNATETVVALEKLQWNEEPEIRNVASATLSRITDVDDDQLDIPREFALQQNYPNPFNPSTVIRYALPKEADVTLTVYNTLGQRVALLVNQHQEAGYYEVVFDNPGLASGVYFYRLHAARSKESFVETKKLLLLR